MSDVQPLSEAVEAIEEQAERKEASEKVDEKVAAAQGTVASLEDDVRDLAAAVRDLQFHRQILIEMFDADQPGRVQPALEEARAAVDADRSQVVEGLIEDSQSGQGAAIEAVRSDISEAITSVNEAEDVLKDRLRGYQTEWEQRLSSARDLQDIIGDQNEQFVQTVDWLEEIVAEKMWETDHTAGSIVSEWENATAQWEDHQDLQGLDAFQRTHGLSDDAISAVERLSSHSNLTLADVDIDVLEELKQIDPLATAVELEI